MTNRNRPASLPTSARLLLTQRFSRHPERYLEIMRILRKYRLQRLASQLGLIHHHEDEDAPVPAGELQDEAAEGRALAGALEELGPCFIKLGQILSTRPDLLPAPYITALVRLQDAITTVPGEQIVGVIERELGAPIMTLFRSFDRQPLAAASMAQVHRAILPDGQDVVVKVQRPGVRRRVEVDLEVLGEIARYATRYTPFGHRYGLEPMMHELEHSLTQELDFRLEADNTALISRQLHDFPLITTPRVYADYSTRRVLTLSFMPGRHLAAVAPGELAHLDTPAIARDFLSAYLKQLVIDGIFHCDPHPGNILITADGHLALMDFGMVGRFDAGQKDNIILLLLAFSERQGERVADTYLELIEIPEHFDRRGFTQDVCALVSRYHDLSGGRMAFGTALLDLTRLASAHRTPVPGELTLLGKTMLNLDATIRVLSPALDLVQLIRDYMIDVMQKRATAQLSPGRDFEWLLDMKHLAENAPRRADMILNKLANDQLTLRHELAHLRDLQRTVNHAATRLSIGMVVGSLIIAGGQVLAARRREGRGGGPG